jgi:AcrR family transcriptional regulator
MRQESGARLEPPPARAARSPRAEQIVRAAGRLLEDEGPQALTMRRLADELGIAAPSLYKHFAGKGAVELALISDALWEIGRVSHDAVDRPPERPSNSPGDNAHALATEYRRMAKAAPNRYRLATQGPLDRSALQPGLEEWAGNPWYVATGDPALAQAFWSFAHGMVILEIDGRYPPGSDLDATWSAGVAAFTDR